MLDHPIMKSLPPPTVEAKFVSADINSLRVLEDWVGLPLEVENGSIVLAGFHVNLIAPIKNALQVGLDGANEMRFAKGREPVPMLVTNPALVTHFEIAPGEKMVLLRVRLASDEVTDYWLSVDTLKQLSKVIEDAVIATSLHK